MTFDVEEFDRLANRLRGEVAGYIILGLTPAEAAAWANHGFTANEVAPWRSAGYWPDQAAFHANEFRSVEEALTIDPPKEPR